ncbi:DNA ligase 1-like isoform X2 [Acropora muricata]|uniref:DNA ligase 1-like isoform X2 n=1 Tax=Acropora muricata TaxID=159855 RepID=UPI0034E485AC
MARLLGQSQAMKWSEAHDIFFLKEIFQFQPWQHKKGSVERGEVWENIACHLGRSSDPVFRVTQRSVRDRYLLLDRRFRKKVSEDEKASGTSPEPSEEDVMMEEMISLFDETDRLNDCKKKEIQEEASQAEEMRNMSLETFKQSQERSQDGQPKPKKQKRASGADTMTFLKDRVEIEPRQRLEELELRKRELQMEKEAKEAELNVRAKEH